MDMMTERDFYTQQVDNLPFRKFKRTESGCLVTAGPDTPALDQMYGYQLEDR